MALREVGSNNPDGIEIKKNLDPRTGTPVDGIPFHPYYTIKDMVGVAVFLIVFSAIVFFAPEMGGYFLEYNNFIPADPLKTPEHIARCGISLRITPCCAPSAVAGSQFTRAVWARPPDFSCSVARRGKVKSIRYRGPKYKVWVTLFTCPSCAGISRLEETTVVGEFKRCCGHRGDYIALWAARVLTAIYFLFFALMPWYTAHDREKPEPSRVTY